VFPKVWVCGAVAFPPEMKQGRSGAFLSFKIKHGKQIQDRQTGQPKTIQGYTRCVMFGDRGAEAAKRIEQGTIVEINGELSQRKDDEGREWTSVVVKELGVPAQDTADQPKSDRGYWRDPGTQPQHAQPVQSAGNERGMVETAPARVPQPQPVRHQTAPPQYAQATLAPQGNPYGDDDIPF